MVEGDRPIRIERLSVDRTATGAVRRTYDTRDPLKAWARREDRGGRIVEVGEQRGGEWETVFTIRAPARYTSRPKPDDRLIDEHGQAYTIEAVAEVPGTRGTRLRLYAVALPSQ